MQKEKTKNKKILVIGTGISGASALSTIIMNKQINDFSNIFVVEDDNIEGLLEKEIIIKDHFNKIPTRIPLLTIAEEDIEKLSNTGCVILNDKKIKVRKQNNSKRVKRKKRIKPKRNKK